MTRKYSVISIPFSTEVFILMKTNFTTWELLESYEHIWFKSSINKHFFLPHFGKCISLDEYKESKLLCGKLNYTCIIVLSMEWFLSIFFFQRIIPWSCLCFCCLIVYDFLRILFSLALSVVQRWRWMGYFIPEHMENRQLDDWFSSYQRMSIF